MAARISAGGNWKGVFVMTTNTTTAEDRLAKLGFHEVDRGGHFAAWEEPELFIVAGCPDSGLLVIRPVLNSYP
jgi:hypothetical protein